MSMYFPCLKSDTVCTENLCGFIFSLKYRQKHFTDQFEWLIKQRSCVGQITKCCVAVTVGTISYGLACRCKSLAGTSLLVVITTNSDLYCIHVIPSTEGLHWGRKFNNQQKTSSGLVSDELDFCLGTKQKSLAINIS